MPDTDELVCARCSDTLAAAEICTFCRGEFCPRCNAEHQCVTPVVRTWSLPPEPGPEVTRLRCRLGEFYERADKRYWRRAGRPGAYEWPFRDLLATWGPLADATPTQTPEESA